MGPLPRWLAEAEVVSSGRLREKANEVPEAVRKIVYARAGFRCESCAAGLTPDRRHLHHRRPRGMGGTRAELVHRASNLLALCPGCHGLVETNRRAAYEAGLLVRQAADPARVPVLLADGRLVLLPDEGGYRDWEATA